MSVNSDIRDMMIHHAHHVERLKASEVRRVAAILKKADAEITARLAESGITDWSRERLADIRRSVKEIQRTYNARLIGGLEERLAQFGGIEARQTTAIYNQATPGVINFRTPSANAVAALARLRPIMLDDTTAVMLEPFLRRISAARLRAIDASLRYSYTVGDTIPDAIRRLVGEQGAFRAARTTAEAVTRTAFNHYSSSARQETARENEDLVYGYEWVATLDRRTSAICQDFDGRVWIFDGRETDALRLPAEIYPPGHPNCRSAHVYLTKSWRELGIDMDDLAPGERASMDGTVPERTTYLDWLERQPADVQRDVLGATRYQMWQDGVITPREFYRPEGGFYTLDQLARAGYAVPGGAA